MYKGPGVKESTIWTLPGTREVCCNWNTETWREGQAELLSVALDKLSLGCWWKFKYVCPAGSGTCNREIWLEIGSRAISMKRSLKPQELIRSLRRSGWSSILLCSSQKTGLWIGFKEFMKWVPNFLKNPSYLL